MKLRNKKTGEIKELQEVIHQAYQEHNYNSLAELEREWEDYEEPKEYWTISGAGYLWTTEHMVSETIDDLRQIGNLFETKEEAEKAVEKLKAWKRLKDKGFRFNGWKCTGSMSFTFDNYCGDGQPRSASDDLDLLFGGEE